MSYLGHSSKRAVNGIGGASCGGCARGMGAMPTGVATTITGDPLTALIQQINRFGPSAPGPYAIIGAPFSVPPDTSTVPLNVATAAMLIMQRAAFDPIMSGVGTVVTMTALAAGMSDPVSYVTGSLPATISTIQLYGDSVGLPPATGGFLDTLTSPTGLLVMAGLAAAYLLTRKH